MKKFNRTFLTLCLIFGILAIGIGVYSFFAQQDPITHTAQVTLEVTLAPDFTLAVSPPSITSPINRTVAYNASVTSINDFTGDVVFSDADLPAGFTVTYFPSDTLTLGAGQTMGVQIDVTIPDDVNVTGTHTLTVTATSTVYN